MVNVETSKRLFRYTIVHRILMGLVHAQLLDEWDVNGVYKSMDIDQFDAPVMGINLYSKIEPNLDTVRFTLISLAVSLAGLNAHRAAQKVIYDVARDYFNNDYDAFDNFMMANYWGNNE
jgi:hypothetical protein